MTPNPNRLYTVQKINSTFTYESAAIKEVEKVEKVYFESMVQHGQPYCGKIVGIPWHYSPNRNTPQFVCRIDSNWNNSPQHPYSAIAKLFPGPLCHRDAKTQRYRHSGQGCRPFGESLAPTVGRQEAPCRQDYGVSLGGAYADVSWSNWPSRTSANGKLL